MEFDLACESVCKNFARLKAVDDVSFSIPRGSFFSILGPSGCGKTTLMRMIAGFETPASGDIKIKGKSVLRTPPNKRNVKMVFQHLALFPMMNVFENIAYGLRCTGADKREIGRRVSNVLERISLPSVAKKEIHQLSGGQKQRIAIARCLVLDPDVLLLDEPLGSLDLKLRESMKIELKLLQHQFNTTFVYITHDQSEALVMSDNVAVMNNGKFEQIGTPQALYHRPATAFVAGFVGDTNRWKGRVISGDVSGVKVETDTGLSLVGKARGNSAHATGTPVEIFVRPEFISVSRSQGKTVEPADGYNSECGIVDSILFNGASSRVLVRTRHDRLVEANLQLTGGTKELKPGEPVVLSWRHERSACFPVSN